MSETAVESTSAPVATRDPICLPTYTLGQEGQPNHFTASASREDAAIAAKALAVGDAAFIKRSDLKWTYAVVTELVESAPVPAEGDEDAKPASNILRFEVDKDKNRKSFPQAQWGKYIRVIEVEDAELARLKAEEEAATATPAAAAEEETEKSVEVEAPAAAPQEEAPKVEEVPASPAPAPAGEESVAPTTTAGPASDAEIPDVEKQPSKESVGGESSSSRKSAKSTKSKGSWFTGLFNGPGSKKSEGGKKEETDEPATVPELSEKAEEDTTEVPTVATSAVFPTNDAAAAPDATPSEPMTEDPAAAPAQSKEESVAEAAPEAAADPAVEPNDTKENSDPSKLAAPAVPLAPAPGSAASLEGSSDTGSAASKEKEDGSKLRSPLKLKSVLSIKRNSSIVKKMFGGNKESKEEKKSVTIEKPAPVALAPVVEDDKPSKADPNKKEWFDPEASEVDYDKNPTDLFQALEARQFNYVNEMYGQVNLQFTRECKTWVVARGQKKKDSQLRFRALPLHAALVFGAPDDMISKILNAYPRASRGRDVKGRLPIHLAMEHRASEKIMCDIVEAFPKGFFAKDKKNMTPLDYVNGNMDRAHMKKYVPLLVAAKVEEERVKWEAEKEAALAEQKAVLKTDPVYMSDVVEKVTDEIETTYATKMEMLESNYQKEIQLLKKKHDSETQALLEGFEVKLNFERKLKKLKAKQ